MKILVQCTRFEDFLADVQFIQIPFELFGSLALLDEGTRAESRGNSNLFFTETWPTNFYFNYRVSKDNPRGRISREPWRRSFTSRFIQPSNSRSSFVKERSRQKASFDTSKGEDRAENIITISCISYN